jgi:hypothetical protein
VTAAFLKAGADVNAHNNRGGTPLMYAVMYNKNTEVITTLLTAGADVKAKDLRGKTAFDYAQKNARLEGTAAYRRLQEASEESRRV